MQYSIPIVFYGHHQVNINHCYDRFKYDKEEDQEDGREHELMKCGHGFLVYLLIKSILNVLLLSFHVLDSNKVHHDLYKCDFKVCVKDQLQMLDDLQRHIVFKLILIVLRPILKDRG